MQNNIQLTHVDHKQSDKKFPLNIIANDINDPLNVGSLFRLCDALGIKTLYLCGDTPTPPNAKINKTSRSAEKYVNYESNDNVIKLANTLKTQGSLIISLEITSSSLAINSEEFKNLLGSKKSACLILGSENTGISDDLLSLSDVTTHIQMYGKNSSMNVISAASIACFEIIKNL